LVALRAGCIACDAFTVPTCMWRHHCESRAHIAVSLLKRREVEYAGQLRTHMPLGVTTVSRSFVRFPLAASGRDIRLDMIAVAPRLNPRQLFGQDVVGRVGSPPSMLSLHVSPDQWSNEVVSKELSAPAVRDPRVSVRARGVISRKLSMRTGIECTACLWYG
jgi:hypothetical protein